MSVLRFRFVLPVLLGLVLLLLVLTSNVPPALADNPSDGVHFFRTATYYNQTHAQDITSNLNYYGGPVMLTVKAYLIFWVPAGQRYALGYKKLLKRYFRDIGGSSFYNILAQYYQNPGPKHQKNTSTFGGAWFDTKAYPHAGSASHPLTDGDIRNEVKRAISKNSWSTGLTTQFFVFTAKGIESCYDAQSCTPGTAHPAYCAYHGYFALNNKDVIYANMPYDGTWSSLCSAFSKSPNNNMDADIEISTTSHEHFEASNDPRLNAWYDFTGDEIADKCAYWYGTIAADGRNMTLKGHPYIIQLDWSNAKGNGIAHSGCVKSQ